MNYNKIRNNIRQIMFNNRFTLKNKHQIIAKFNKRYPATQIKSSVFMKAIIEVSNTSGALL